MLTSMFLSMAIGTMPATGHTIVVVDDRPTVTIFLANYDLTHPQGVIRVKSDIRSAADRVCGRGTGLAMLLESTPCWNAAVADANGQLGGILAHRGGTAFVGATIAVSAHSK